MLQRTVPSVTPDSTGVEIAAAVLEDLKNPNHWGIHWLESGGRRCLLGSAMFVCGLPRYWIDKQFAVAQKLAEALGFNSYEQAAHFNNVSTHEQVLQRLRDAVGVE